MILGLLDNSFYLEKNYYLFQIKCVFLQPDIGTILNIHLFYDFTDSNFVFPPFENGNIK
jgi:hypothetical protein